MLDTLNAEQKTAVLTMDRPVLALSTAGTGKTHMLTAKAVYACETLGYEPTAILCATFTRKAANELRSRVSAALQRPDLKANELWIGTFHALSSRILHENPDASPLGGAFTVIQPEETRRIMAQVIARIERATPDDRRVGGMLRLIDHIKGVGAMIDEEPATWPHAATRPMLGDLNIIRAYQQELAAMSCYDYGDLICETIRMLRKNPDILADYRKQFRLLLIDEYQDTDRAQQEWIRLLCGPDAQLTCVGDDDQSIYRFRGARVEAILEFGSTWPNAEIITLSTNYRCAPDVLQKATAMIAHNPNRHPKIAKAASNKIGRLHAVGYDGQNALKNAIAEIIDSRDIDYPWNSVAVLCRTNQECNRIAADLAGLNMPVHIFMPDANSSAHIQTLIAWIRLLINQWDDAAFITICDQLVARPTVDSLYLQARMLKLPMLSAARRNLEKHPQSSKEIADLVALVDDIDLSAQILDPEETINMILAKTRIEARVNTLPSAAKTKFWRLYAALATQARIQPDMRTVLETAQNDLIDPENIPDAILISTMHGMKGLQSPIVISPGWEKNNFPRRLRKPSPTDLEDERRAAFVTITRASGDAYLLYDKTIGPSVFLEELDLIAPSAAATRPAA
jgi:DNA helicase-2/ATP-dependent DNA helicase PcrA